MKDLKEYILETYDDNHIVGGYPIGKIQKCIEKEYKCKCNVDIEEDCVIFSSQDDDAPIFFTIERIPKTIVCPQGIKDCLMQCLGFDEDCFEVH
jgi:hypothetical protein